MKIEHAKNVKTKSEAILSFEHYHDLILFALDILAAIIVNHGQNVSFIFDSAISVFFQLLSGANYVYSDQDKVVKQSEHSTAHNKIFESKKVNKKVIECLGSLSRFLPQNELNLIIDKLCQNMSKCVANAQYSTLKNLFNAIIKISNDQMDKKGLSQANMSKLCGIIIGIISNDGIKQQIEVREYGFMALETLIKNSNSSNIIGAFPQILEVVANALRFDPNWVSLVVNKSVKMGHDKMDIDEKDENDGWSDGDDDSWGNDDEDDGFTNDLNDDNKADADDDEGDDMEDFEKLNELNEQLDDDDDDSWKVRRSSNKCLLAMIRAFIATKRDFNPNMFRLIVQKCINQMIKLLNNACCERVLRIKMSIFETYNVLLMHLNQIYLEKAVYITLDGGVLNGICDQFANSEYLKEVLSSNEPQAYESMFEVVRNLLVLNQCYHQKSNEKVPAFVAQILPICVFTISHYTVECFLSAFD